MPERLIVMVIAHVISALDYNDNDAKPSVSGWRCNYKRDRQRAEMHKYHESCITGIIKGKGGEKGGEKAWSQRRCLNINVEKNESAPVEFRPWTCPGFTRPRARSQNCAKFSRPKMPVFSLFLACHFARRKTEHEKVLKPRVEINVVCLESHKVGNMRLHQMLSKNIVNTSKSHCIEWVMWHDAGNTIPRRMLILSYEKFASIIDNALSNYILACLLFGP